MKCQICKKSAVIKIRAYNAAFCARCFHSFFIKRVKKAIDKYRLFHRDDKLLMAVSGGKDSLTVWDVLQYLGYQTEGLFIDLAIDGYSEQAEKKVKNFALKRNLMFSVERITDILGYGIKEISKIARRPACAICGLVKRYIMNQYGVKNNYDVIVTGHNLDDEVATLMGNVINWQHGYLARQAPRLERYDGLASRAKPLVLISERESAAYAYINNIDYHDEKCPYSHGASSILYKKVLNDIELAQPASKLRFYKGFLKNRELWKIEVDMEPCVECGYPTTAKICTFCRLKKKISGSGLDIRH